MQITFPSIKRKVTVPSNIKVHYSDFRESITSFEATPVFGNPAVGNKPIPRIAQGTIIVQTNTGLPFTMEDIRKRDGSVLTIKTTKDKCTYDDILKTSSGKHLGIEDYLMIIPFAFLPSRYFDVRGTDLQPCWSPNAIMPARDVYKVGYCRNCPYARRRSGDPGPKCTYKIVMYYIVLNDSNASNGYYPLYWYSFKNTGAKVTYHEYIYQYLRMIGAEAYRIAFAFKTERVTNNYGNSIFVFKGKDYVKIPKYDAKIEEEFANILKYLQEYEMYKIQRYSSSTVQEEVPF